MIILLKDKSFQRKAEIFILVMIFFLFIFRTALPVVKYPFILLYIVFFIITIIINRNKVLNITIKFLKDLFLPFCLFLILAVVFFTSCKIYLVIFKDVINTLILFSFFYLFAISNLSLSELKYFKESIYKLLIFFGGLISFIGIYRSFNINLFNQRPDNLLAEDVDYNFALLPGFLCFIVIVNSLKNEVPIFKKYIFNIILLFISVNVVFSGSLRGIFVLMLIMLSLLMLQLSVLFLKNDVLKVIAKNTIHFILSFFILLILFLGIIFGISYKAKIRLIEKMGTSNVYVTLNDITGKAYKYISAIQKTTDYNQVYNFLWRPNYNPKDPDSGWGVRKHKTVFPLSGENAGIVPNDVKGYLLDSTSDFLPANNNAYSFTQVAKENLEKFETFYASIFCYVSPDFNGSDVKLYAEGSVGPDALSKYDFNNIGKWQKLSFSYQSQGGITRVYASFSKINQIDFENLKGHVIFAFPQFQKVLFNPGLPETWGDPSLRIFSDSIINSNPVLKDSQGILIDKENKSWFNEGNSYVSTHIGRKTLSEEDSIIKVSVFCFVSDDFNGNWVSLVLSQKDRPDNLAVYGMTNRNAWQELKLESYCKSDEMSVKLFVSKYYVQDFSSVKGFVIFAHPQIIVEKRKTFREGSVTSSSIDLFSAHLMDADKGSILLNCSFTDIIGYRTIIMNPIFWRGNTSQVIKMTQGTDPIRKWVSSFISEDTTYTPYKSDLGTGIADNFKKNDRLVRWKFAFKIFSKEYTVFQKLFGNKFNFLNWYGYHFLKDRTASDWPHNPFLSILLYSGIVGLLLYLCLLYKVFYYYIKYRKEYFIFFIFFLIAFFFSFFSGGSPFDPPVMGFFTLLPFFIHSIYKNDGPTRM
jgi:hypothetical protein